MRFSQPFRAGLIALTAVAGAAFSSAAYADSGSISFRVLKAGFVIGGSGGSGTLTFHGQQLPDLDRRHELWLHLRRLARRASTAR